MRKLSVFLLPAVLLAQSGEQLLWRHRNVGKALFETPTTVAESVAELRKALDLAPKSFRDQVNYGMALLRAGSTKEAIVELEKAQKLDPKPPHSWFNLGVAYKREGRYEDAIRQFQGMIRLVPDEPVSHYNLGVLYNLVGKAAEALREFEIAAKLDPKLVAPRFQIYTVYRLEGKEEEAARALSAFQDAKQKQKEADDSEDMEWCYYAELYDPIDPAASTDPGQPAELRFEPRKLAGSVDPKNAGLLVLDADGDGKPDLLAWGSAGLKLYRNGAEPVESSGLAGIAGVRSVAAGDFDNDELADLCIVTDAGPLLFRNAKGKFEKHAAKLPAGRFNKAVWLDFDHEYDLDLFLLGAKSVLLRNEGPNGFREHQFPFAPGNAGDAVAFRIVPDTKAMDLAVFYGDRKSVLYRDQLRGVYQAEAIEAGDRSRSLSAEDVNNDGWIDLAYARSSGAAGVQIAMNRDGVFTAQAAASDGGAPALVFVDLENRGLVDLVAGNAVYRNQGAGKFLPARTPAGFPKALAWVAADFNLDGRADLAAVTPDGSVQLLENRTATKNQWIRVSLSGVKNLKLAAGTEVEVKAGPRYQKRIYDGAPLVFGLGAAAEVDTIRISWPNGLIQNQPKEPVARAAVYKEAPRLSGSCPMIFTWNGREFQFITDVLGVAPLGASAGDGSYFSVDHDEYIQIPGEALALTNGNYEVRITEELREVTYLDQVRLIAVDHPASVEIFTNDKFKSPPYPEFRLFGVSRRVYPRSAVDHRGADVLARLVKRDRAYPTGFRRNHAGVAELHHLDLDFGSEAARGNNAALVLSGWVDWADGSTFLKAAQESKAGLVFPYVQVKDAVGNWKTVVEDMGIPAGKPKTIVVDLTGKFLSSSRAVRIVTNLCVYWDEAFLTEETATPAARLTHVDAHHADLRLRGFSRPVIHPRREQPESFEYARWMPSTMWNPTPGFYTRYGDVRRLVNAIDDRLAIMGSGDELRLLFSAKSLPALEAGWKRDFLLFVDGWAKDGDANTAHAESVTPLPFHGMSAYPYPEGEKYPDSEAYQAYLREYNTRPAVEILRPLARRKSRAAR